MLTKQASIFTLFLLTCSVLSGSASAQWDANTDRLLKTRPGHTGSVYSVSFSPDGNTVASGSSDKTVLLWDANTSRLLKTLTGHTGSVYSVSFSPDGNTVASGSSDKTILLWDANTSRLLKTLTGHTSSVYSVSFSPDARKIASGSGDNTVLLWDANTGRLLKTFTRHTSIVRSVSFSPDGDTIASGSWDKTVRLWDMKTGRLLKTLTRHTSIVRSVSFSPDGDTIASGSWDKTVRLWDAKTGRPLKTFTGHTGSVYSVSFSPDGDTIASGSSDNTVRLRLWDVNPFVTQRRTWLQPQTPSPRRTVAQPQTPEQIAKTALASTVLIVMVDADGDPISTGSGSVLEGDRVATNLHVVEGVLRGYVKRVGGDSQHRITGIIAMDRDQDLAVLSVVGIDAPPLRLAYHRKESVGERVYVAGNPIGFLEGTFSDGLVSGIRDLGIDRQWLQISAPISEGSSGGPVLNRQGEVIGIAVAQLTVGQNLNFAIPVKYLTDLLEQVGR